MREQHPGVLRFDQSDSRYKQKIPAGILREGTGNLLRIAAIFYLMLYSTSRWSSLNVLCESASVWYFVRKIRFTVTAKSHLTNSNTQKALFSPVLYIRYKCLLEAKSTSMPRCLLRMKVGEMLCPRIWAFTQCLSWMLFQRPLKPQRDLSITLNKRISISIYLFKELPIKKWIHIISSYI